jgi:DNA invertase Pin-like site-specific DNA recombinase
MAAVGYFREHAGGGATLAEQNRAFMDFCSKHGLPVRGTFADDTGANGRSPGFRELVSFLRSEGATELTILIPSIDALGQDLRDAAVRMYQLEGLGAHVRPMTGNFDDAETALLKAWTEDGTGRMSARVRQAMRKKAVKGEVLGRPPYGYKVGALRRLELVPDEAVVVRYIFRLYLQEQIGIRLIARRLNEEGLKTRRGGNWSMVSIRDILRNRAYLGTYSRFDVHVSGSHPSLVSPTDFHKVQERLTARRTSYAPKHISQFLLSGLAYCGYCGNKLIGVSRKQSWKRQSGEVATNSYRYYQCESRTNQSMCGYHTRRADVLEEQVRERLSAAKGADTPTGSVSGHHTDTEAAIEKLTSKVRSIDRKLEGFVDAAARGRIAREQMHAYSLKAAAERLSVDDELEQLERDLERRHDTAQRRTAQQEGLQRLLTEWDALPFEARQTLMRGVVCRVDVNDDGLSVGLRA